MKDATTLAFAGPLKVKVTVEDVRGNALFYYYLPQVVRWPQKVHIDLDLENPPKES